ncbi:hypothetical protein H4Q26_017987 [Puccinia striiformis f. sp. tritici PST-130]|nr:hypothetical protein H4Q26_017987 [Puccinia striiformis f. sp. tritici PST-130]
MSLYYLGTSPQSRKFFSPSHPPDNITLLFKASTTKVNRFNYAIQHAPSFDGRRCRFGSRQCQPYPDQHFAGKCTQLEVARKDHHQSVNHRSTHRQQANGQRFRLVGEVNRQQFFNYAHQALSVG